MGIFKKTVKYSKASKDLNEKIKSLDEGLKKTGVILDQNDVETFCVEENIPKISDKIEVVKEEEQLYHWRETLLEETNEEVEDIQETHTLTRVENYISESNKELIVLRDQVFKEISEQTLLNLPEIKTKISKVLEIYEQLQEGLLNEPPEIKNEDPLTPIDQKFVTLDDLNKHYSLFVNRVQEQLATLGGGGETKLKYLDDIVGIATNASAYDGQFLSYDDSIKKFKFKTVTNGNGGISYYSPVAGIATYATSSGVSTYATSSGLSTYATLSGIATYSTTAGVSTISNYSVVSGIATYATTAGIATYSITAGVSTTSVYANSSGIATYSSNSGISTYALISGISTYAMTAGIATYTTTAGIATVSQGLTGNPTITVTDLQVNGNANINGNLSIGGTSVTISATTLTVGDKDIVLGITTNPTDTTANHGGIAIASTEGSPLVSLQAVGINTLPDTYKQVMWIKSGTFSGLGTDAWMFNYAVGIGSTQVPNGVRLAVGNVKVTDTTVTATTFTGSLSGNASSASYSPIAGISTYSSSSGISTYASISGIATYATSSGVSTTATTAGYATTSGISTTSQGLTGTPDITIGIITSTTSIPTQLRTRSVAERTSVINGNTISLIFNTGSGNVAICTNPTGDITLNVTGIPTDSSFDNHSISFSAFVQQTGTARTCTAVNLNGVSRTIRWAGGSLANALSGISTNNGYDIFTFTGINTVGSASTAANYVVLGSVNGGFN